MIDKQTAAEPVTCGSVWASADEIEVVIVTGVNLHGMAVMAFGWVSYGTEGSVNYDTEETFRRDYPRFIYRVKPPAA